MLKIAYSVAFLVGSLAVTALIIWWSPYLAEWLSKHTTATVVSQEFSGTFNIAGSALSGLGFFAVVAALLLQWHDLRMQKQESQDNQRQLAKQIEGFREQLDIARSQRFESTFFNMIEQLEKLRASVVWFTSIDPLTAQGRSGINGAADVLCRVLRCELNTFGADQSVKDAMALIVSTKPIDRGRTIELYNLWYDHKLANHFGHFFRSVYVTLRFVQDSTVSDKETYVRILRSHMSQGELCLLFYNGFGKYGWDRFLPLAMRWNLFKNLDPASLANPAHKSEWLAEASQFRKADIDKLRVEVASNH